MQTKSCVRNLNVNEETTTNVIRKYPIAMDSFNQLTNFLRSKIL